MKLIFPALYVSLNDGPKGHDTLESFLSKVAFESGFRKKISCVPWKLSKAAFSD